MKKFLFISIVIACLLSSCSLFESDTPEQKFDEISPDIENIVGTWVSEIVKMHLDGDGFTQNIYTCTVYTFYADGKLDKETIDLPSKDIESQPLSSFIEYGTYNIYPESEQIVMNIEHGHELTYIYSIKQDGDKYSLMLDDVQYVKS